MKQSEAQKVKEQMEEFFPSLTTVIKNDGTANGWYVSSLTKSLEVGRREIADLSVIIKGYSLMFARSGAKFRMIIKTKAATA